MRTTYDNYLWKNYGRTIEEAAGHLLGGGNVRWRAALSTRAGRQSSVPETARCEMCNIEELLNQNFREFLNFFLLIVKRIYTARGSFCATKAPRLYATKAPTVCHEGTHRRNYAPCWTSTVLPMKGGWWNWDFQGLQVKNCEENRRHFSESRIWTFC